jgi:quinoprotein glucose dehydrogenase
MRKGENRYAQLHRGLARLDGEGGVAFQTVHHDVWDYDNASPPALTDVLKDGKVVPAVLQATRRACSTSWTARRERRSSVEERAVPRSTVAGEETSATQPSPR